MTLNAYLVIALSNTGIEALVLYQSITLGSVVDVLRVKCSRFHHDFKTRYVQYELPSAINDRLEQLHFVKNRKDLREKYREATRWYKELVTEVP